MPPKKKSGAKKKVVSQRGFATVSVPRRKDPEEEEAAAAAAAQAEAAAAEAAQASTEATTGGDAAAKEGVETNGAESKEGEWDGEAMEKHELQTLSEKIRPGCDKEVSRVSKVSMALVLFSFRSLMPRWFSLARSSTTRGVSRRPFLATSGPSRIL